LSAAKVLLIAAAAESKPPVQRVAVCQVGGRRDALVPTRRLHGLSHVISSNSSQAINGFSVAAERADAVDVSRARNPA
jgi:hypothetical protein